MLFFFSLEMCEQEIGACCQEHCWPLMPDVTKDSGM